MTAKYTFDLVCPRCGRQDMVEADKKVPPPSLKCGDCLATAVEIVELKIVRVFVGVNP